MHTTTQFRSKAAEIARALEQRTEEVAHALLGDQSSRTRRDIRWGRKGSLWVGRFGEDRGRWYDHERGEGGDLLDLIARERNVPLKVAMAIAGDMLGNFYAHPAPRIEVPKRRDVDAADRVATALRLWQQSVPIDGTPAEKYFVVERRLAVVRLSLKHALRWHSRISAIVALMTDAVTGEAIGIHRTFLDRSGKKLDRRMLGRQGVIRVAPDEMVTSGVGIAEGLEDVGRAAVRLVACLGRDERGRDCTAANSRRH